MGAASRSGASMDAECWRVMLWVLVGYLTIHMVDGESVTTSAPSHQNRAYFNETLGSSVTLSNTLHMRSHIAFSFRTCSYGQLIYQQGATGNFLRMALTKNGSLEMSWRAESIVDNVTIGADTLRNNKWYTIDSLFIQGEIYLSIEQGSVVKYKKLVSNSTYRRYLWDLDLTGGSRIQVGAGFSGCIQEGPGLKLSDSDTNAENVLWGQCPLELRTVEGCDAATPNPCWTYPCQNGGSCANLGDGYRCNCPLPYSGRNCENDLGYLGCELKPCQNGGTCRNHETGTRKYLCDCVPGFTGVNCEIDINECAPGPCQNGGVCENKINDYSCNCSGTGFSGPNCNMNIDECKLKSPCQNNATCTDTPGSYKCECSPGFAGKNCEDGLNECSSNPCKNGAACSDFLGYYACTCKTGFSGVNCEVDIDDCVEVTCPPMMHCVDAVNNFTCRCKPGYFDPVKASANSSRCEDIDECFSGPCHNSAPCVNEENHYTCRCLPGYTGLTCETDVNECASAPCLNGARCVDGVNNLTCECLSGFTGPLCETNIDDCQSSPCQHGGTCHDLVAGYNCSCVAGWTSTHCEVDINECQSSPCYNGATCVNQLNAYACLCVNGFTGENCETNIDDCDPSPCENAGVCEDGVDTYTCHCGHDWMGHTCSQKYDACAFNPCHNNGSCILATAPPSHNYTCDCVTGFTGHDCGVNIDDCKGHSCPNYTVCVDGVNKYECQCPQGYTGEKCEVDIDECESNPCLNGGVCTQGVGNYTCSCVGEILNLTVFTHDPRTVYRLGFEGVNCEVDINECALRPGVCQNGGLCNHYNNTYTFKCYCDATDYYVGEYCHIRKNFCSIEPVLNPPVCHNGGTCTSFEDNMFECECQPGFEGVRCMTNINECRSNPCQSNGTCVDGVNGYTCECIPGMTGDNCETEVNECYSQPCQNEGQCVDYINSTLAEGNDTELTLGDGGGGYKCNCSDTGFTGEVCQLNINDCLSLPCQHGGTCLDGVKDYTCRCLPGYAGVNCEQDIDECASSPCQNSATCRQRSDSSREGFNMSAADGYDCDCVPGFAGMHCETDIDECASGPCVHGSCVDAVNRYSCQCIPGYRGTHCETEINECHVYRPCHNGATCVDRVADYDCECPTIYRGVKYGGKNCTVKLIGCENHHCSNGATCSPFLVDELTNVHDYKCSCTPGFTDKYCHIVSTATFSGATWMYFESTAGETPASISLHFRTTLPSALLVNLVTLHDNNIVLLQLVDKHTLQMVYSDGTIATATIVRTSGHVTLNDANWHQVVLTLNETGLWGSLQHPDCDEDDTCVSSLVWNNKPAFRRSYFGGNATSLPLATGVTLAPGFIGCMQDVIIDSDEVVVPMVVISAGFTHGLVIGCERRDQCVPDPCSGHGACVDLWHQFKCTCRRPYFDVDCSKSLKAATFGHDNVAESYAVFSVPQLQREQLRDNNDVSFFFRTRHSDGLIYYIGDDPVHSPANHTFIVVELRDGHVQVRLRFTPNDTELVKIPGTITDGLQHFLHLNRSYSMLRLTVDEMVHEYELTGGATTLSATHVYLGGLPAGIVVQRRKRETVAPTFVYRGTIQDIRQNGHILRIFADNVTSELPPSYDLPTLKNVKSGEVSDDVCGQQTLCENNATCVNVFYSDFKCICPAGFIGRNCSEVDFCFYATCPDGATCHNLHDGYECVAPATFDGKISYVQYGHSFNTARKLGMVSMKLRSRQTSGVIFHVGGVANRSANYVTLQMVNSSLLLHFDLGTEGQARSSQSDLDLLDGGVHNISIEITDSKTIVLNVDTFMYASPATPQSWMFSDLIGGNNIFLGGVSQHYRKNTLRKFYTDTNFKGCLDDARIGDILLPFFSQSEMPNNSAAEQFFIYNMADMRTGCHGDDVCATNECRNSATCRDVWNLYVCDCTIGFNGSRCENNIDDCVDNGCMNGATCVDGIANYTCDCVAGYTGPRCETNIDECTSSPCHNNATCVDLVNGYVCNCSANYTGVYCENLITDNCESLPCQNNGTCIPVNATTPGDLLFNCSCVPGYTGLRCEDEIDYCDSTPCQNNAKCTTHHGWLNYTCDCPPGYSGLDCETNINECASNPCLNGECIDGNNSYTCFCPGWSGLHCGQDIDECNVTSTNATEPCLHGECINTPGSFHCNCANTGYYGLRCENDTDECADPLTCHNGATCTNTPGDYNCNCTLGYEGKNCDIANCSAVMCENKGNCSVSSQSQWHCQCVTFFQGVLCETRGPCVDAPCKNSAVCHQGETGSDYNCSCLQGWQGKNCSTDIDECNDQPCMHGGTCNNTDGSYSCTCAQGYTGHHCETDINECASDPCQNGGVCKNEVNQFTCDCANTGYGGAQCELDIDECLDTPCHNGGNCTNLPGTFACVCLSGYVGDTCHSVNPCNDTAFCQNGGNCTYKVDNAGQNVSGLCTCTADWTGPHCTSQSAKATGDNNISTTNLIIIIIVAIVVIIIIIVVISLIVMSRGKRGTRGTYSPSRQEMSGSRVEMGSVLKLPPEERLI